MRLQRQRYDTVGAAQAPRRRVAEHLDARLPIGGRGAQVRYPHGHTLSFIQGEVVPPRSLHGVNGDSTTIHHLPDDGIVDGAIPECDLQGDHAARNIYDGAAEFHAVLGARGKGHQGERGESMQAVHGFKSSEKG